MNYTSNNNNINNDNNLVILLLIMIIVFIFPHEGLPLSDPGVPTVRSRCVAGAI